MPADAWKECFTLSFAPFLQEFGELERGQPTPRKPTARTGPTAVPIPFNRSYRPSKKKTLLELHLVLFLGWILFK